VSCDEDNQFLPDKLQFVLILRQSASEIHNSEWLLGPKHLLTCESSKNPEGKYQLVDPDSDGEIRPNVHPDISVAKTLTTLTSEKMFRSQ
jgi:hypothetical protein